MRRPATPAHPAKALPKAGTRNAGAAGCDGFWSALVER